MNKRIQKGVIAFDFDSVISTYIRPWTYNILGEPVDEIVNTMKYYYDLGYYILILTGRFSSPKFVEWLTKFNVPYNGINIDPKAHIHVHADRFKPYFDCLIDDKAVNFHWSENRKSKEELIKEIDNVLTIGRKGKQ